MPLPRDYFRPGDAGARPVWRVTGVRQKQYADSLKLLCRKYMYATLERDAACHASGTGDLLHYHRLMNESFGLLLYDSDSPYSRCHLFLRLLHLDPLPTPPLT